MPAVPEMPCECNAREVPLEIFEQTVNDSLKALIRNVPKDVKDLEAGLEIEFSSLARVFDGIVSTKQVDPALLVLVLTHEKSPFRLSDEDSITLAEGLLEAAGCPIQWADDADADAADISRA